MKRIHAIAILLIVLLASCEQEVNIDVPNSTPQLVVTGHIENGEPPIVMLSRSAGYFDPVSPLELTTTIVQNARVFVQSGGQEYELALQCDNDLPEEWRLRFAATASIPFESLDFIEVCLFTVPLDDWLAGNTLIGEVGGTYELRIEEGGQTYSATTTIPELIAPDSFWFEIRQSGRFGHIRANLNDPARPGNSYRWFHRRIHPEPEYTEAYPVTSLIDGLFDDQFFNGESFDLDFRRSGVPNVEEEWEGPSAPGYFTTGDTVISKFCTMDAGHYTFWSSYQRQVFGGDNPFSSPSNIRTNITGGALGVWGGYGVTWDTVICVP